MKRRYVIYPGVKIGKNAQIGDFVIIGVPSGSHKEKVRTAIGENAVIRSHTVIYAGNIIGKNFQTGHGIMVRENNKIGDNVSIGTGSVVEHHIKIGDNVRLHSQVFVPEFSVLKNGCWLGPHVVLTNVLHPLCPEAKKCRKGATIGRNAKIGANTTILPDIKIGDNALIGAGSVIVRDVAKNKVIAGSPGQVIKDISQLGCPYKLRQKPY